MPFRFGDRVTDKTTAAYGIISSTNSNGHACKLGGRWIHIDDVDIGCQMSNQKTLQAEPSFEVLQNNFQNLSAIEKRVALSLVGLALGDAIGFPFELGHGKENRGKFHKLRGSDERLKLATDQVRLFAQFGRYSSGRQLKPSSGFHRTYSDDTTCCDLKMEAVAQADKLLGVNDAAQPVLQNAVLQQYLKWAHGAKGANRLRDHGDLFFGTGGFTEDFLVPEFKGRKNCVYQFVEGNCSLFEMHPVAGHFWPTSSYTEFARRYFSGELSFPSWGNGAAMSFAPHPILAARFKGGKCCTPHNGLQNAAGVLSMSHQEDGAKLAAELLWELLDEIYGGAVSTSEQIKETVLCLPSYKKLLNYEHECYPILPFQEWLENGDSSTESAHRFLDSLSQGASRGAVAVDANQFDLAAATEEGQPFGVFGALLHIAADWNDERKAFLMRKDQPHEPVLFSNRGLNSVLIAIFAAAEAESPWDAFHRLIYVGGDTDTVGAIVGQLACPLFEAAQVLDLYADVVGLAGMLDRRLLVANAAARRYFQRSLLFASGDLEALRKYPSLLDPEYVGLTTCTGELLSE